MTLKEQRMNLQVTGVIVIAALCIAGALPAAAHHSFAMFDAERTITLSGTVKEFQWANPHALIWLTVEDAAKPAPVTWAIELTSPGNLRRGGWNKESLKPGDRVEVTANPLKDGGPGAGFFSLKFVDSGKVLSMTRVLPPKE
jgi:hypothetical protein